MLKSSQIAICCLLLICTLIIFFFSSKFSYLYNFNYWSDINIYFTIGKGIIHNKVIYKDLFDHKGPLIFFIYSIGYSLTPCNFLGMFFVQSIFQLVSLIFTYKSLSLYSFDKKLSIVFSLFIFFFLLNFNLEGGSAEEFIFTFQVVSFYYFIKYFKSSDFYHKPIFMFIHGIMFACVFYIKLNIILFWFFPLLLFFITLLRSKLYKNIIINISVFILGVFFVSIILFLYFFLNDALTDFWHSYIIFNSLYVKQIGFEFSDILIELYLKIKKDYFLFSLLFVGLLCSFSRRIFENKLGSIAFGLTFVLMIIFTVPNSTYLHYYLIPLMPFALFILIGLNVFSKKYFFKKKTSNFLFAFLLLISISFLSTRKNFFSYSFQTLYTRDFPETSVEKFSEIIDSNNGIDLLVLDIGSGLSVYTLLDITPSVKYFFYPNIGYDIYPTIMDSQNQYIEDQIAKYIIVDENSESFNFYKSKLMSNYEQISKYKSPKEGISLLFERKESIK